MLVAQERVGEVDTPCAPLVGEDLLNAPGMEREVVNDQKALVEPSE